MRKIKNSLRRSVACWAAVVCISGSLYAADPAMHTIVDMCGRSVQVPVQVERIAAAHCVSPEKIMTLGGGGRLVAMAPQSPWAYRLFPEIGGAKSGPENPAQLKQMKVDLVLYTPGMTQANPYSQAGLTTACAFSAEKRAMTLCEFPASFEKQVDFFGELLGPEAKRRAARYDAYFEKKVKQISAITAKIPESQRPKVYYGGLRADILFGQGMGSVMHWDTEIAGGRYLPKALDDNHAKATFAQVQAWDPDIILVSGLAKSTAIVTEKPEWATLRAVKAGRVYLLPQGIYAWDHASNENVLLMIYLAKIFYPAQFKHWDMVKETQRFYAEIYGKQVSAADVQRILAHQPPQ